MRFLKKPELSVSDVDIFLQCIESYDEDQSKYARLQKCEDAVNTDTGKYQEEVLAGTFKMSPLPKNVTKKELKNVYAETFVKEDKPGRVYYELIRGTAVCAKCPICGSQGADTHLDHYLPKSRFPTLCVMPYNLIPVCESCNKKKSTNYSFNESKRPLHLYFDELPTAPDSRGKLVQETFLYAKLQKDFQVTFHVKCPDHWSAALSGRVKEHVRLYKLLRRYSESVYPEIAKIWCMWTDEMDKWLYSNPEQTEIDVKSQKELLLNIVSGNAFTERFDPNSWRSALYRAMEKQVDVTYFWLRSNEDAIKEAAEKYLNR